MSTNKYSAEKEQSIKTLYFQGAAGDSISFSINARPIDVILDGDGMLVWRRRGHQASGIVLPLQEIVEEKMQMKIDAAFQSRMLTETVQFLPVATPPGILLESNFVDVVNETADVVPLPSGLTSPFEFAMPLLLPLPCEFAPPPGLSHPNPQVSHIDMMP